MRATAIWMRTAFSEVPRTGQQWLKAQDDKD